MTWNDITVKQFYELGKVNSTYEDDFDRRLAMIAACYNTTYDDVVDYKMSKIAECRKEIEFTNTPLKSKVLSKWGNYRFVLKLSDLSAGQLIHFLEVAKDGIEDKLHTVMAILSTDYSKRDFQEVEKDLLNCPIPIVKGINDFFFRKYKLSPEIIQKYSLMKMQKLTKEIQKMNQTSH